MYNDAPKSFMQNYGTIIVNNPNNFSWGMKVCGTATSTNESSGTIELKSSGQGMVCDRGGSSFNNGTITTEKDAKGAEGMGAGINGQITNNANIVINSDDSFGMFANGNNSTAINVIGGTITISKQVEQQLCTLLELGQLSKTLEPL